jgi:cupin 2 domain-containing protein
MPVVKNLLNDIPASLPQEYVQKLLRTKTVWIERIVSLGHRSPDGFWYDQKENEFVVLLSGAARLMFEGQAEPMEMTPGSFVDIPAHRRHRVEWTDPEQVSVWLVVYY